MCYHVSLTSDRSIIKREFKKPFLNNDKFETAYHFNGFSRPYLPVLHGIGHNQVIDVFRWGLIPHWVKEEKEWKANTLNARNDEIFEKVSYKQYWKNRCLVICNGFFEPHIPENGVASKIQKTESWFIKPQKADFFTLGGLYSNWKGINTLTIVTTHAGPLLSEIHNEKKRQPLILEGENAEAWLLPDLTQKEMADLMLFQAPESSLTAFRTIDGVMNSKVDTNVEEVVIPK